MAQVGRLEFESQVVSSTKYLLKVNMLQQSCLHLSSHFVWEVHHWSCPPLYSVFTTVSDLQSIKEPWDGSNLYKSTNFICCRFVVVDVFSCATIKSRWHHNYSSGDNCGGRHSTGMANKDEMETRCSWCRQFKYGPMTDLWRADF